MKNRIAWLLAVALLLATAFPSLGLADYVDSNGNTIHWAGGDNIVVTDKNGNTVYVGPGVRVKDTNNTNQGFDRLAIPPDAAARIGSNATPSVVESGALTKDISVPRDALGRPAYSGPSSTGSQYSHGVASPYNNYTVFTGLQPVVITINGKTYSGYANVYSDPNSPDWGGASAVPVTSGIGQILAANGFQVKDGMVLIHNGSPLANVRWEADPQPGTSLSNVSTPFLNSAGGGHISITLVSGSGGGSGGTVQAIPLPTDKRSFQVSGGPAILKRGETISLVASYRGEPISDIKAVPDWGGETLLTKRLEDPNSRTGEITVPAEATSGPHKITVSATLAQPGLNNRSFAQDINFVVDTRDMRNLDLGMPIVIQGSFLSVSVEITGDAVGSVTAQADWGTSCTLTSSDGIHYVGTLVVPFAAPPGVWAVTAKAKLVQNGITEPKEFALAKNIQVKKGTVLEEYSKTRSSDYDWSWFEQWYNPWGK